MNNINISVIVVSFNTKLDFLTTLRSIQNQTFKNYETIVVDGDSTDGTKDEIIKNKNYISKSIIEKDKGIYDAMNKGIEISSGRWIIFLNSGDIFYNDHVLMDFSSNGFLDSDIVYGDAIVQFEKLKYLSISEKLKNESLLMPFCHQSVFVKSKILKEKKFSLEYKFSADFEFFFSCLLMKKNFQKFNKIISQVKSGGSSDKNRQTVFNENIDIIKKNTNSKHYYKLYYIKLIQYFKDFLKMFLPKKFQNLILKLKYQKKLIK